MLGGLAAFLFASLFHWLRSSQGLSWWAASWQFVLIYVAFVVALALVSLGGLRRIHSLAKIHAKLRKEPGQRVLVCMDKQVAAVIPKEVGEEIKPLWRGLVSWNDGPRITRRVRRMTQFRLFASVLLFFGVGLPLFLFAVWFGRSIHWGGYVFLVYVGLNQFGRVIPGGGILGNLIGGAFK